MANITKPVLLAVVGILAVVLILQGSSFITGKYGDPGAEDIVTTFVSLLIAGIGFYLTIDIEIEDKKWMEICSGELLYS